MIQNGIDMIGIEVRMAVMSHLSDAQEIGNIALSYLTMKDRIRMMQEQNLHINFAKRLLMKYKDNLNVEISEEELDELWKEICNKK